MSILTEIAALVGGLVLSILMFSSIALPIGYGIPRAMLWAIRGWARWGAVVAYLLPPVFWSVGILGVAAVVMIFAPSVSEVVFQNEAFAIGVTIGLLSMVFRAVFSKAGRNDLTGDFRDFIGTYLTCSGKSHVERQKRFDANFVRVGITEEEDGLLQKYSLLLQRKSVDVIDVYELPCDKDNMKFLLKQEIARAKDPNYFSTLKLMDHGNALGDQEHALDALQECYVDLAMFQNLEETPLISAHDVAEIDTAAWSDSEKRLLSKGNMLLAGLRLVVFGERGSTALVANGSK